MLGSIRHNGPQLYLSATSWLIVLLLPWAMPVQTAVFGIAWWTVFREKRSSRAWGIAASVVFIAWFLLPILIPPHHFFSGFVLLLAVGIVGVIAFSWPAELPLSRSPDQLAAVSGDGTSSFINKALPLFMLLIYFRAYSWWLGWLGDNELSSPDFIHGTVTLTLVGLLLVALHEFGHTFVGLLLGMKLRAFAVGPFQWRIREGKWEFRFELRQILATSGATGIVPTSRQFPNSALLSMVVAGVVINAATGAVALWLAYTGAAPQLQGVLALFGTFSLITAAMNFVPFRIQENYSDGAQIYQILSRGAWADYHRVLAVAGASLVSPVRPRDYDIEAIRRAAHTIAQGRRGLLLRLLAHSYFLDQGNATAAGEELLEAASIYNTSASDAPADFVACFVFGSAYIWRNADTSRQWWAHFEAKSPVHNSDFWLSHSALRWVEGDLKGAGESLDKARALAQQLPNAGAYEFERYRCALLQEMLKDICASPAAPVSS